MQALMLAAGSGKRLGKLTKENTKCMLEVCDEKLIDRAIDAIKLAGIKKLVLVVGYARENLINYLNETYKNDKDIELCFVENPIYDKTNNIYSLALASSQFASDDTILLESDIIYDKTIIKTLVNDPNPDVALVAKYESWMDGTVVTITADNTINQFIEKKGFHPSCINEYYKTVNIYKFSKEFINKQYLPFLQAYMHAYGQNEYYETVLKAIAHLSRADVKALITHDKWYEIDDVQDHDIATAMFSAGEKKLEIMQNKYGGYWRYSNLVDFCYLVNPYFPDDKFTEKMARDFNTLIRQYPSGMQVQVLNASRMFGISPNYLLVGNGAAELINVLQSTISGKVGVPIPTFNEYVRCFPNCTILPLDTSKLDYRLDVNEIISHLDKVDHMVLVNPDNPSGSFLNLNDTLKILDACKKKNKTLIFDESFIDFATETERFTLLNDDILAKYENLIVIKSISKSYGVPGLRLGILACSNIAIIKKLKNALPVWNINSHAEHFLQNITLFQKNYFDACNKIVKEREFLTDGLTALGFKVYPSSANFLLVKANLNSTALAVTLLNRYEIFIKDLTSKFKLSTPPLDFSA